jgi:hypothetical protein
LAADEPAFYATFTVTGERVAAVPAPPPPAAPPGPGAAAAVVPPSPPTFQPPGGLAFEAPDLIWENFDLSPLGLLVGDQLRIRADLRNVGGDLARDIQVQVRYFNTRIPDRLEPIADTPVGVLAPGEKIELEWEFRFPDDALLGEYQVTMEARTAAGTAERNLADNRVVSERPIALAHIRPLFPEPDYRFDETGLFLFRWESKLYKEFKVQVGVDPNFQDRERYFDIPQGEAWTRDQEVVPLEGELPGMARGLMDSAETQVAYWRVVGRDTTANRTGYSRVNAFTIRPAGGGPGAASAQPAPEPLSPPANPAPRSPPPAAAPPLPPPASPQPAPPSPAAVPAPPTPGAPSQ